MSFTHKSPLEDPEAEVYFLTPEACAVVPVHCYNVYVFVTITEADVAIIIDQLPAEALVIDYDHGTPWTTFGLQPKIVLEEQVVSEWRQVQQFLTSKAIDVDLLARPDIANTVEPMDDALDTLLAVSHRFIRVANEFQRALELARPLRITHQARREYDAVILLAHRVQALSTGTFTQHFLESYNEDDTFFLYDKVHGRFVGTGETLQEAVIRHMQAGRPTLARALLAAAS